MDEKVETPNKIEMTANTKPKSDFFMKLKRNIDLFSDDLFKSKSSPLDDVKCPKSSPVGVKSPKPKPMTDFNVERTSSRVKFVLNIEDEDGIRNDDTDSEEGVGVIELFSNLKITSPKSTTPSPKSFAPLQPKSTNQLIHSPHQAGTSCSSVKNQQVLQSPQKRRNKFRFYKDIDLEPQIDEILGGKEQDVSKNIIRGPYKNPVQYLNVHFKLLREDFITPLREGIQQMRREFPVCGQLKQNEHVTLYAKCKFNRMSARKKVVGYELCFDVEFTMKMNEWRVARSLFNGTLLALSDDGFKTFFFGYVVFADAHDMLYRRVVSIQLCNGRHLKYEQFNKTYAMIEPAAFFVPYYYVMQTLQSYSNDNFPFAKYFIRLETSINTPAYLTSNVLDAYKLNADSESTLGLNPYQFKAYTTALTQELAIIQGPPGTGKTFVGLKIVESFLKNKDLSNAAKGPIMIVCYTNHALDQFVQGVLEFTQNVCRLGYSRSNDKVKPYNYMEIVETFIAIKRAIREKKVKRFVTLDDFHTLFTPSSPDRYQLQVMSFKTEVFETRSYKTILMKAYFYMYIQSPMNRPTPNNGKWFIDKQVHKLEDQINRITEGINVINKMNGILDSKPLQMYMDSVSNAFFKESGTLENWLTNSRYELSSAQLMKIKSLNTLKCPDESEYSSCTDSDETDYYSSDSDEYDFDLSDDTDESDSGIYPVFYKLDLDNIRNDMENIEFVLKQSQAVNQTGNRFIVNQERIEMEQKLHYFEQVSKLVKEKLSYLSNANGNLKEIETKIVANIKNYHDLSGMTLETRWNLYWYWLESFRQTLYAQMKELAIKYAGMCRQLQKNIRDPEMLSILRSKDVIAMTTTKAAKIHSVLCQLRPKIVVIEEAAEVMEAHIIASLTRYTEHVVLIGDHKQLRPMTSVHDLARNYHLDVSLFERLVDNNLPHITLEVQHRMRPEICNLLVPSIYTKLTSHSSVKNLPNVKGMHSNVQFFNHKVHEGKYAQETSLWNTFEVVILLNLADYLLRQGYSGRDITIIAAYNGQVEQFQEMVTKYRRNLSRIRITSIDAYQGEENKIILLSLVRSNSVNNVGFLGSANRVCVALSRAKHGLFMMGNMDCLAESSKLWTDIKRKLEAGKDSSLDNNFKLKCSKHGAFGVVKTVEDWEGCCCFR